MLKKIISQFLFWAIEIYAMVSKQFLKSYSHVVIPFYKTVGVGDFVMLSPVVNRLAKLIPHKEIYIITELPDFISFPENVKIVKPKDGSSKKEGGLLLSLFLNLKHFPLIFKNTYWEGYFSKTISQSNLIGANRKKYDGQNMHYLERALPFIPAFFPNEKTYELFENNEIEYPEIKKEIFSKIDNIEGRVLTVGLFSQFDHSLWDFGKAAKLIDAWFQDGKIQNIVILGDSSERNKNYANELKKHLTMPKNNIYDFTGGTNIQQAAYCISKSNYFFGVDSGLAHLAYGTSTPSLVVFVVAHPKNICPRNKTMKNKIFTVHPYHEKEAQLFNGFDRVNRKKAKNKSKQITIGQLQTEAQKMFSIQE